jgi:hypothetical protein
MAYFAASRRAVSSAVEHCFHTAGVTGSIPVPPTMITAARSGHIGLDWALDSLSYPVHRGPLTARFEGGRCAI